MYGFAPTQIAYFLPRGSSPSVTLAPRQPVLIAFASVRPVRGPLVPSAGRATRGPGVESAHSILTRIFVNYTCYSERISNFIYQLSKSAFAITRLVNCGVTRYFCNVCSTSERVISREFKQCVRWSRKMSISSTLFKGRRVLSG